MVAETGCEGVSRAAGGVRLMCDGDAGFGCAARGSVKTEDEGKTELEALELVEPEDLETNGDIGVTVAGVGATGVVAAIGVESGLGAWSCVGVSFCDEGAEVFVSVEIATGVFAACELGTA